MSVTAKGRVISLAGRTNLAELAALLSVSPMHVGVDSAAPHIAAAVGTPTLSLYGPTDWRYWNQGGDLHRIVVSDMECIPCRRKGCEDSGQSRCLDTLGIDKVQEALEEMMRMRFN
jgi:heptosyltransferase-3